MKVKEELQRESKLKLFKVDVYVKVYKIFLEQCD